MIHGSIWYMSAYTPGTLDRAHPTPHVTRPTTYQRPVSAWQTSGAPPSPSHASFPSSPPAHSSLSLRVKASEPPVPWRLSALLKAFSQLVRSGTRGTSTLFWMNWKDPSLPSLPQPATQHLVPVPLLNWWLNMLLHFGRQAALTLRLERRFRVWLRKSTATSNESRRESY